MVTLGALTKPLFAIAPDISILLTARLLDRVEKAFAARPAMPWCDIAPAHLRGAAFGLRQSLDTVGAFIGPLLAVGLMLLANDFRAVFWVAVVPGMMAVALLLFGIQEPRRVRAPENEPDQPGQFRTFRDRPIGGWWESGRCLRLARFSEAFSSCAHNKGHSTRLIPLVKVAMNLVYASSAYPFGRLSEQDESRQAAHLRPVSVDRGRSGLGLAGSLEHHTPGRDIVGPSHGHDARTPRHHGG